MAGSLTPSAGVAANALRSRWDGRFIRRPNENRNISKYFMEPEGVDKIGDTLYIRILPVIGTNSLSTSDTGLSLTYDNTAIDRVAATPAFSYSAVRPTLVLVERMDNPEEAKMLAGYRTQLLAGLWSSIEATAAQNATTISTQLGAPSNITEALFLQAKGILRGQGKEYTDMEQGDPMIHFVYDTTQIQYVESIPAIMHAQIRGDKANPTVQGVVQEGWGFKFNSSTNIYKNAGVAYNMLFTKEAFVLGFNVKPRLLDPQPEEATVRYIAIADSASTEVLDECAVIIRSPY
jgi:hypothetical protein